MASRARSFLGANVEQALWCGGRTSVARAAVLRALEDGHNVGSHTYSHMSAAQAMRDPVAFSDEVLAGEAVVRSLRVEAGMEADGVIPFSLPFGPQRVASCGDASTLVSPMADPRLQVLAVLGRPHIHWTESFPDWAPIPGGAVELAAQLIQHIGAKAAEGLESVIALHDSAPPDEGLIRGFERSTTVDAVRLLLEHCRRLGWRAFTVAPPVGGKSG